MEQFNLPQCGLKPHLQLPRMSVDPQLTLYSRPDCHLCDVAAALLDELRLEWRKRDIEGDLELIRRYGRRIPVLVRGDSRAELGWPFDADEVQRFLEQEV